MANPKRIRVALDLSCVIPQPLTGVGVYALRLTHALLSHASEIDVRIFASSAQRAPDVLLQLRECCPCLRSVRFPTRVKNLLWTRAGFPPIEWFTGPVDLAHGMFHLLPAARAARRVATVFDLSGLRFPSGHSASRVALHLSLLRHAAAHADRIVAISESGKADVVELLGVNEERVRVVYGGVLLEEFAGPLDAGPLEALKGKHGITRDYLIHLGTLEPRKNLPRLIEAYARVRDRRRDCPQLVLAGGAGWMFETIFETIERLHLARDVIHIGYLERTEAIMLLRGAWACVYPSLYEGFGLPVLEAMAARTPVLTSNVSSLPEVVGDTGILVDPGNVSEIEAGLVELIEHREAALRRTEAAYERATHFTWENSARALVQVYRELMGADTR